MELLNVSFIVSEVNGTPELNFSVSVLPGSNISQVLLFGVDTWDNDGHLQNSTPANFAPFQNPTPPPYGSQDVFKSSWIAKDSAFNSGTISGFKVIVNPDAPSQVAWFAYVTQTGQQLPIATSGWAALKQ